MVMTGEAWEQKSTDSIPMLLYLRDKTSERKVLLFNCACCRRIWAKLDSEDQVAIEHAEAHPDDPAALQELQLRLEPERSAALAMVGLMDRTAHPVSDSLAQLLTNRTNLRMRLLGGLGWGIGSLAHHSALAASGEPVWKGSAAQALELRAQAELVREVFGNPFRPISLDLHWLTSNVVDLARTIYGEQACARLPILADALMDAGCENADILEHCKRTGPHVRGCWVVDLLLGQK